jgi:cellulose synthase operon protein YhjQ
MDGQNLDRSVEQERASLERRPVETPEDVAVLYSWANLHGAKYRDFSASRREYRAQMRHRAAEQQAEVELQAKQSAESAEREAAEQARMASGERKAVTESAIRREEAAAAAARHAAALSEAQQNLQRAEREVMAAREAAQAEAALYAERQRMAQYSKEHPQEFHVTITDPYVKPEHDNNMLEHEMHRPAPAYVDRTPFAQQHMPLHPNPTPTDRIVMRQPELPPAMHTHVVPEPIPYRAPEQRQSEQRQQEPQRAELEPEYPVFRPAAQAPPPGQAAYQPSAPGYPMERRNMLRSDPRPEPRIERRSGYRAAGQRPSGYHPDQPTQQVPVARPQGDSKPPSRFDYPPPQAARPAWLYADHDANDAAARPQLAAAPSPLADTLQHSRERVASRWFALKGVFDSAQEQEAQPVRQKEARTPALALFSLAGGVGKTSMVATLGRALASLGEKVLLTDTTSYGLLPFYFGARELRPGVVRTFSPPSGSTDAPIYLVNYDVDKPGEQNPEWMADEIARNSRGTNRILLDLGTGSASLTRRIAKLNPTILVPVAPDMNSVIGLSNVEKYFAGQTDNEGRPIQPMYLLNQFDASLPLHLDVREVMRQQLGDRLLPFVIRRSPAVSEALAEGMTVMDYAPGSPVAEDYMNLAGWLRSLSAPAAQAFRGIRWSER